MLSKLKEFDFYRKIPKDLTETTFHGSILSVCASVFMLVLFIAELWAFLSSQVVTNVIIDPNTDSQLRINFNITVLDIPCEYLTIDVVDVLGTKKDNVTRNVNKWKVDEAGFRRNYEGRNTEQPDIMHDTGHDLELLHSNGIHAIQIDDSSFENFIGQHHYTFVNFFAPWCIWCQRLEPVWEAYAEKNEIDQMPVSIVSVDCVANMKTCMGQNVKAFPTLRLFKDGQALPPDYRSDRTVEGFSEFIKTKIQSDEAVAKLDPASQQQHHERVKELHTEHPGCNLAGFLQVNR